MYLQSLLVIFCLLICSYSQDTAETPPLPEDDPANFRYQDATKLVELGGRHWVKRRTYTVRTQMGEPICEYAQIHGKVKDNEYTLELGAKKGIPGGQSKNTNTVLGNHRPTPSTERSSISPD
uniref:Putative secreted protein n=1 Tax=Ixodes ricinus TaxID=34613 RepID=V5HY49_IXORI